jgi:AcrR family transcriptional regulator
MKRAKDDADGRERILQAAIRSFADLGYAATTTVDIARKAGVTHPNVHHHFGSKEGLWRAAVDRACASVPALFQSAGESPVELLEEAVIRFVLHASENPDLARLLAHESATPGPRLTYILDTYTRRPLSAALATLRAAQAEGLVAADLDPVLLLIFVLGGGQHLFKVPALAREAFGIDVSAQATRDAFAALVRRVLREGVFRTGPPPR